MIFFWVFLAFRLPTTTIAICILFVFAVRFVVCVLLVLFFFCVRRSFISSHISFITHTHTLLYRLFHRLAPLKMKIFFHFIKCMCSTYIFVKTIMMTTTMLSLSLVIQFVYDSIWFGLVWFGRLVWLFQWPNFHLRNKIKLMAISGLLASEISSRFVDDDDDGSASVCVISVVNVLACLLACFSFFFLKKNNNFFFSSSTFGVPIGTEQNQPTNQPTWPKKQVRIPLNE